MKDILKEIYAATISFVAVVSGGLALLFTAADLLEYYTAPRFTLGCWVVFIAFLILSAKNGRARSWLFDWMMPTP